jgi:MGT family glycosyltransferase
MSALRILFTTMPIPGHVRPGLPIARELVRRGHEVSWYTGRAFERTVARVGASFAPIPAALEPTGARRAGSGLRKLRRDVRHGFLGPVPHYLDDVDRLLDTIEPHVVVADQGFVAGPLVAERRRLPSIVYTVSPLSLSGVDVAPFGTGLPPASTAIGRLRNRALDRLLRHVVFADSQREARRLREGAGLDVPPGFFLDWPPLVVDRYLHGSVPEFEYPRRDLPPSVEFVGALLPDGVDDWTPPAWWPDVAAARAAGRPVVVVTQGTVATDPRNLLLPAIDALAGRDAVVVATTGGRDPDAVIPPGRRPPNLRLEAFVPFAELLPAADALVTNGGYGGVQAALASGVPLVVAGRSEDKMEVSARVAWSGAGIALKTDLPTPGRIAAAVEAVLADPSYARSARRLQAAYARHDAAARAADLVLDAGPRRASGKAVLARSAPGCRQLREQRDLVEIAADVRLASVQLNRLHSRRRRVRSCGRSAARSDSSGEAACQRT